MSDKIKRLAQKLEKLFLEPESIQSLYDNLGEVMFHQRDYFNNINPVDRIKLLFYIWSLKQSNDFLIGEKLLNKISFAEVFYTEGNPHIETCEECGGNGEHRCDNCDATGIIRCDECDGAGEVACSTCEGKRNVDTGDNEWVTCSDCEGTGVENCPECSGEGDLTCNKCGGASYETCRECEGNGDIRTEEQDFIYYFICTWNKELQDRCELTENTLEPAFSEYTFDEMRDEYVTLFMEDDFHEEFVDAIEPNEIYCISYNDNPRLMNIYRGVMTHKPWMGTFRKK